MEQNCDLIYQQMKRLGFSADWDRSVYAASPEVIKFVYETFRRMEAEGFIYRDDYLINYCPHCGTSLAELEVKHLERKDPLYFIKYGPFTLATVRPETKFGDTAVAVHPDDQRYQKWVGQEIEVEGLLGKFKLKVIADRMVDPKFGTGVVKITPAHDPNDFEAGRRHNLEIKQVIDHTGRLTEITGPYAGLKTMAARERVVADLKKKGLLVKVDPDYAHAVTVCYKCGRDLEPMITPNWFIKVKDLKTKVRETIEKDRVKFFPHRFKKHLLTWLDIMHDWPISRQIAWAIRIPAWYAVAKNPRLQVTFLDQKGQRVAGEIKTLLAKYSFTEIEKGLQTLVAHKDAAYEIAFAKPKGNYLQETDTFDTLFSSGQWPLLVL